jgi:Sigma-70 region 3
MVEMINKLGRMKGELRQHLGREPTPEELAKEMGVSPEKVLELQHYAREPLSLDQTIGEEGDSRLGDFVEDSQAVAAVVPGGRGTAPVTGLRHAPCHGSSRRPRELRREGGRLIL